MNKISVNSSNVYKCWLNYELSVDSNIIQEYKKFCSNILVREDSPIIMSAVDELKLAINTIFHVSPEISKKTSNASHIFISTLKNIKDIRIDDTIYDEGFFIRRFKRDDIENLMIVGKDEKGVLYGAFSLIRAICNGTLLEEIEGVDNPQTDLRMINHWDNMSGDIERGYAGKSIFFENNKFIDDFTRIKDYARLLASVGINAIVINNVNVHQYETKLITDEFLPDVSNVADIFRDYGIQLFLSVNYASPIEIGGLPTADPLDDDVKLWWRRTVDKIYSYIPDFGGFLVKADSEFRPGPFTYGRDHAEGANMLAEALRPYNGLVIWRCFVYDCLMDWRNRTKDRAKAAYDNFKPLDGQFMDNVILQVKNGPMDFQIREPVSPLFGAMEDTNMMLECQITQEYTGQQKHLCYLVPMWKETLDFDTLAKGEGSYVNKIIDTTLNNNRHGGIAGVSNIGNSKSWTGHPLAQANLYGFGRLAWNSQLTSEEIAEEWVRLTFGNDVKIIDTIVPMLLESREVYEMYTSPLGIGWMVNPGYHYGPNVDGYEYSKWGTYHYADWNGLGVDRTVATGTGYIGQYNDEVQSMYENLETCPEELLLFFHHVPYTHRLRSGKTVIQHIYDTHFEGVEKAKQLRKKWLTLEKKIDKEVYNIILERFDVQVEDAKEWRDVVNTYFYRKTGIKDVHNRKIYE
ncbi:MAG: Xylan alpha-(1-_2)-glucuronosidase [Xylanivirga thermophila]|uniref:alpha-glucuronidase family glycosyl hydrolase n=1 Tax=Xylanivirga thermophila TaxID=2496273 RepID=UPI0039F4C828